MEYVYNDGGRSRYYRATNVSDCVTRAIAIATEMDYKKAYKLVWKHYGESPRNGVSHTASQATLKELGWEFHKTPDDVPDAASRLYIYRLVERYERVIVRVRTRTARRDCKGFHLAAFIKGDLHDTWDWMLCKGDRLMGYWIPAGSHLPDDYETCFF